MKAIAYNSRGDSFDVSACVVDHPKSRLGNGKVLKVIRNGSILAMVDCRFIPDFQPLEVFKNALKSYFYSYKIVDEHDWRVVELVVRQK